MDEQSENEQSKDFITWDDLATEMLSEPVNNDLDQLPIQEVKLWPMRWAILIVVTIIICLIIVTSMIIYLLTKSPLALLPPTGLIVSISVGILQYAGRFAFWRENDYRLAAKKLEFKAKKLKMKRCRKNPRRKSNK